MLSGIGERGQAIQIGAVLLFGLLVISFAIYQAFVVPDQNKQVEFKHSQTVQQDLQDLRNEIVSLSGSRVGSVAVPLGTQYPSRAVALNPGPPSGSIRTAGTGNGSLNVTIRNATGSGPVGDFWNGSTRRYGTGALVYQPNYNVFQGAPTVVYENSVLFNQFRDQNVTLTGQRLVDGTSISLVTLNGSLSETRSGSYSVAVDPVSVSDRRVEVRNDTANVTVSFPTRLGVGQWRELLDGEFTDQDGHVAGLRSEPLGDGVRLLHVDMEPGVDYDLRMKKVGIGTGVSGTGSAYLLPVEGNGTTIPEGATTRVVVEVRDGYNNPVGGRTVNASASLPGGSVSPGQATTDGDGRLVLEYDAPDDISGVAQERERVNVSFTVGSPNLNDSSFDASAPESATIPVRVTNADSSGLGGGAGGGGAYDVNWANPDGQNGVTCAPDEDGTCTIDGGVTSTVDVRLVTSPTADGAETSYAVSNQSVGTVSPSSGTTNSDGEDTTTFTLKDNGTVNVYGSSGGGGDVLDVEVVDFNPSGIGETSQVSFPAVSSGTSTQTVQLDQSYDNPVVIARPVDNQVTEPRFVEVRSNSSDTITLAVAEFDSDSGVPPATVHYLVMEAGIHELQDGTLIEAGVNEGVDGTYSEVQLDASFSSAPVVFSQALAPSGAEVVERQQDVTATSFEHTLQEAEFRGQNGHGQEDVSYVAIENSDGSTGGTAYEVGRTGTTVNGFDDDGWVTIGFSSFSSAPTFFAQMQTENGGDTAWERYRNLGAGSVDVVIDEENAGGGDGERSHGGTENVGYFAFGEQGTIAGTTLSSPGSGGGGGSTASVGIIYRSNSNGNLFSVDASGGTIDFGVNQPQNVGSPIDFDGDSALEVPHIDQGGRLDIVDKNGDSSTLTSAPQTLRFGSGNYRGSDVIAYVNGGGNLETVDESGSSSELRKPGGGPNGSPFPAGAVAGVANADGDSPNEIYYASGSEVRYVNQDGPNDKEATTGFTGLADPQAISNPANFGVGSGAAVAVKNGNGNIEIVNTGTTSEISLGPEPQAAPMGAYDYTGDSTPEVIFVDQSNTLRYVTVGGSVGQVTDSNGDPITVQNTPGVTG